MKIYIRIKKKNESSPKRPELNKLKKLGEGQVKKGEIRKQNFLRI